MHPEQLLQLAKDRQSQLLAESRQVFPDVSHRRRGLVSRLRRPRPDRDLFR
jgi:hypothetical protein